MTTEMAAAEVFRPAGLEGPAEDARSYIASSRSANTARAYRSDWAAFTAWCDGHHLTPLPADPDTGGPVPGRRHPETLDPATPPGRHLPSPQNRRAPEPHRRPGGPGRQRRHPPHQRTAPTEKAPAVTAELAAMVNTLRGIRDRAMLLLGFAAALRRCELVALDAADTPRAWSSRCGTPRPTSRARAAGSVSLRLASRHLPGPGPAHLAGPSNQGWLEALDATFLHIQAAATDAEV